jgi:UDP-2,4-diacetamido-2,4,6-trideoxy-beta-L-altropyranose hydrolase
MNHVLIRADGSKKIGMGHINRSYLLANYLQNRYNLKAILLVSEDSSSKRFLLNKKQSLKTIYLDNEFDYKQEIDFINKLITLNQVKLLLLDLLDVENDSGYIDFMDKISIPICVISDSSYFREFPVNLVINGNPNQLQDNYIGFQEKYLIGPKYFIMDQSYSSIPRKNNSKSNILVSLGGTDHNDIMFKALKLLVKSNYVDKIVVISSNSSGYSKKLENLSIDNKGTEIELHFDVESLSPYWQTCGLAITAGGNTLFERIASGIPGATICQLERQMEIADSFENLQVNVNLGFGPTLSEKELSVSIEKFLKNDISHLIQSQYSSKIVPGNGLELCANELNKLM